MLKVYLTKKQSKSFALDGFVGDPFGGPAYNKKEEPITLSIIGLGIAGVSAYEQYQASEDQAQAASEQAQAQKESIAAQQRSATVETQRQRLAQVREARIRRAQILASTGGLGAGTSSVAGSTGSIGTQAGANIGIINQQETFAQQATTANINAANAASAGMQAGARVQQWQQIGKVGESIFSQGGGGWTTIFGGNTYKGAK